MSQSDAEYKKLTSNCLFWSWQFSSLATFLVTSVRNFEKHSGKTISELPHSAEPFYFFPVNVLISLASVQTRLIVLVFTKTMFLSNSARVCVSADKAFSPHSEAKKQAMGPDDLRTSSMGRPVLSPYPISPRDMAKISHEQHMMHLNCKCDPFLSLTMCF